MNDKISSEQSVNGLKDQIEFSDNIWHENYISFFFFHFFSKMIGICHLTFKALN